ncbi:hypothetical protein [Microbulbifer hydrolyticus]|uniref:Lipoprotein n=1 Tax=Microbulbifer hydrolyticus TaxID=48074 RepID=A0A6P1TDB1_9GAMM|nr:hypothetical protein [Microbulbifer hydrolyticus]MBB5211956.1 hypothetical protein [Microbulbifer hydrolyticus]QHQ39643.1 hypothetical protein GTQ55_12035 [Microbulbifer hydrolyticus]
MDSTKLVRRNRRKTGRYISGEIVPSYLLIIGILFSVTGCTAIPYAVNCIDAKIPREAPSEPVEYRVSFKNIHAEAEVSRTLICQEFYDAQCSTKGNGWSMRQLNDPRPVELLASNGSVVRVLIPYCNQMVIGTTKLSNLNKYLMPENVYIEASEIPNSQPYYIEDEKGTLYFDIPYELRLENITRPGN